MGEIYKYPSWVCAQCGLEASRGNSLACSTYHVGICDICGKETGVTQPRDFYYPDFEYYPKPKVD